MNNWQMGSTDKYVAESFAIGNFAIWMDKAKNNNMTEADFQDMYLWVQQLRNEFNKAPHPQLTQLLLEQLPEQHNSNLANLQSNPTALCDMLERAVVEAGASFSEYKSALEEMHKELEKYKKNRGRQILSKLKDFLVDSPHNIHTVAGRQNIANTVQSKLDAIANPAEDVKPEEAYVDALEEMCHQIEEIADYNSSLRQLLIADRNKMLQHLHVFVQPVQQKVLAFIDAHLKKIFIQELNLYATERNATVKYKAKDFAYPQKRDTQTVWATELAAELDACQTPDDYFKYLKNVVAIINTITDKDSRLRYILLHQEKTLNNYFAARFTPEQMSELSSLAEMHTTPSAQRKLFPEQSTNRLLLGNKNNENNLTAFYDRLNSQFINETLSHMLASAGVLEQRLGKKGELGGLIGGLSIPMVPGTGIAFAVVGGVIKNQEQNEQAEKNKAVATAIKYMDLPEIAKLVAEKITARYAHQIQQLYHKGVYNNAINKMVNAAIKNMIIYMLSGKHNQIPMSKEDIEAYKQLNADEKQKFALDKFADLLVQGVNHGSSWIFSEYLTHKDDENVLRPKNSWNTRRVFDSPGLAVVDSKNNIKFYSGVGFEPEKYGYRFATADEVRRLNLREVACSPEDKKHYLKLHTEAPALLTKRQGATQIDKQLEQQPTLDQVSARLEQSKEKYTDLRAHVHLQKTAIQVLDSGYKNRANRIIALIKSIKNLDVKIKDLMAKLSNLKSAKEPLTIQTINPPRKP